MPRIDHLKTAIKALTNSEKHVGDTHFTARVDALDALENYAFELADLCPSSRDEHTINELQKHATALRDELQSINERMFKRYRTMIAAGSFNRAALLREFSSYSTGALPSASDNLQYDALDVLIASILHEIDIPDTCELAMESEMVAYQPTPARAILEMIRQAEIVESDVFCDIGAGLGHVPILVSLLTGATAEGIEVQPAYCRHAERCAAHLGLKRVRFTCQDARSADFSSGTLFYLYTPFTGAMLQAVLGKLHDEAQSREIRVCTYGPHLTAAMTQPLFSAFKPINANSPIALFKSVPR